MGTCSTNPQDVSRMPDDPNNHENDRNGESPARK